MTQIFAWLFTFKLPVDGWVSSISSVLSDSVQRFGINISKLKTYRFSLPFWMVVKSSNEMVAKLSRLSPPNGSVILSIWLVKCQNGPPKAFQNVRMTAKKGGSWWMIMVPSKMAENDWHQEWLLHVVDIWFDVRCNAMLCYESKYCKHQA